MHESHKTGTTSAYYCPVCGGLGMWRRGVHFDHEKICMDSIHPHSVTWCPDEVIDYRGERPIDTIESLRKEIDRLKRGEGKAL